MCADSSAVSPDPPHRDFPGRDVPLSGTCLTSTVGVSLTVGEWWGRRHRSAALERGRERARRAGRPSRSSGSSRCPQELRRQPRPRRHRPRGRERRGADVIGPSGSGKSTLLRCINLLEPLDSGRIFFEGEEITRKGADVSARPPADRDGLPAVQPLPAPDRDGQPHARRAADPQAPARGGRGAGAPALLERRSGSRTRRTSIRTSSPAASSSGSRSRAR